MISSDVKLIPINKIFIANRGEIVARIHKTATAMAIETVAIKTDFEPVPCTNSFVVFEGDNLSETYLNADKIIAKALECGADAIHPGYGFLSENHLFAAKVEEAGLTFIGPSSKVINEMGNKINARKIAESLKIPLLHAVMGSVDEIVAQKDNLPYPLLIKASAGGGGKGMVIVDSAQCLEENLIRTSHQAESYFGNGQVYVEQYIENPRHIEVQIIADKHGNVTHLFERECSIQRRYQKIIEEAPAPFINDDLRHKLYLHAIKLAKTIDYTNVGTVEFLVDSSGNHYFLEMNTRIQVEHPVTELITGIDIVKEQINIAMGLPISFLGDDLKINGHAIELRVYAEDPANDFQPSPGNIVKVKWPNQNICRTDSWFNTPVAISSQFDPMLAKIICHGRNRAEALIKSNQALDSSLVIGIKTNVHYLQNILNNNAFADGYINTHFCSQFNYVINEPANEIIITSAALAVLLNQNLKSHNIWSSLGYKRMHQQINMNVNSNNVIVGWQQNFDSLNVSNGTTQVIIKNINISTDKISFIYDEKRCTFHYALTNNGIIIDEKPHSHHLVFEHKYSIEKKNGNDKKDINGYRIMAPIPGLITKINFNEGDMVSTGDTLCILEAMKMENHILAQHNAVIEKIHISAGFQVKANEELITFAKLV